MNVFNYLFWVFLDFCKTKAKHVLIWPHECLNTSQPRSWAPSKIRRFAILNWIVDNSKFDSNHYNYEIRLIQNRLKKMDRQLRLKSDFDKNHPIFDNIHPFLKKIWLKIQIKDWINVKIHQKWSKIHQNCQNQSKISKSKANWN